MQTTATAGVLALGAGLAPRALAGKTCPTPNPIPGGFQFFGPGTEVFHVFAPGVFDPIDTDSSAITDFNGVVGYAIIAGFGTETDAGGSRRAGYEVDIRFMQGEFVAADGKHYHRLFGFL
jgi:hypothetical protein